MTNELKTFLRKAKVFLEDKPKIMDLFSEFAYVRIKCARTQIQNKSINSII